MQNLAEGMPPWIPPTGAEATAQFQQIWTAIRLLLGLKGTMSEAELHIIRARLDGNSSPLEMANRSGRR